MNEHELCCGTVADKAKLCAEIAERDLRIKALTEGLQAIKRHMEIMGAGNLGAAWNIADVALKKAEAIGK